MTHYDEHTLTAYVLGLTPKGTSREAIESHCAGCHGCREIVGRLESLYSEMRTELEAAPAGNTNESGDLVPVRPARGVRQSRWAGDIQPAGFPIGRRLMRYVYRHPVTSGTVAIVAGVLMFLTVQPLARNVGRAVAGPPAITRYNARGTEIEVCNADSARLWGIPVENGLVSELDESVLCATKTRVADLDRNGNIGVVTASSYAAGGKSILNSLRMYSESGSLLQSVSLGRKVSFRGGDYPFFFQLSPIAIVNVGENRPQEVIAVACNYRSPCGVYRISAKGEILGEYWHYGWVRGIRSATLRGMDHDVVILCGANEVFDKADSAFPCIVVLDPLKLTGLTQSTASPGFGFAPSAAELMYVKAELPRIPVDPGSSTGKEAFVRSPKVGQDSSLIFYCAYRTAERRPEVSFAFDNTMRLQAVFLDDNSRELLRGRYLSDRSPGAIDRFLEKATAGVSYWNGARWTREPSRVRTGPVDVP